MNSELRYFMDEQLPQEKETVEMTKEVQHILDLYDLLSTLDKVTVRRLLMSKKLF